MLKSIKFVHTELSSIFKYVYGRRLITTKFKSMYMGVDDVQQKWAKNKTHTKLPSSLARATTCV